MNNDITKIFENWKYIPSDECMRDVCKNFGITPTQYNIERTKQHLIDSGVPLYDIGTKVIKKGRDIIIPIPKQ